MNHRFSLLLVVFTAACASESYSETEQNASAVSPSTRWPQNPIHYWIDTPAVAGDPMTGVAGNAMQLHCAETTGAITDAGTIAAIHEAIAAYEAQTPLRFVELTSRPTANPGFPVLIYTQSTTSTNPHSGGIPPLATTSGNWQGCVFIPGSVQMHTIEHETGHQVGLQHEQRRSDYCTTINIDTSCATPDSHDQMGDEPFETNPSSQLLTPYDIHSIMEYGNNGFCDTTRPACYDNSTKTCLEPPLMPIGCTGHNTTGACALGGATDFSPDDLNALYRMYEPSMGSDEHDDQLGAAMAAGDFDGDGYTDLAVAAVGEAPGSEVATGTVMLYKGTEGGLVAWKILYESDFIPFGATTHAGDRFGASIAAGKYFNSTIDDLIIGAPGYHSNAGAAFIYRGHAEPGARQPTPEAMYTDQASSGGADQFGSAVAIGTLGGVGTIAVGAPGAAIETTRNGMWFLRHINDTAWKAYGLHTVDGVLTQPAGTNYGIAIAFGLGDIAVGAPNGMWGGGVYLFDGSGATISNIVATSPKVGDQFGKSLAFMQFNGKSRLAIGAPNGGTGGTLTLTSITAPMQVTSTLTESDVNGLTAGLGDAFGASLAVADLDGDGDDDLVVGTPGKNHGQGIVALFHGGTVLGGWIWRGEQTDGLTAPAANDGFGTAVAAGKFGDVFDDSNSPNDRPADFAVGAPNRVMNGQAAAGAFQEFLGQQNSTPVFQSGFDENRVNGIQTRRAGAPAPMTCMPIP